MRRLIVSMMRLSTAMTLYGYEQLGSSMELVRGEQELNDGLDRLQGAIDSLSDVLVDNLGDRKKETLSSITSMSKDVVKRFSKGLRFMDPRETIKAAASMIERSSETLAGGVGKATSIEGEEPKPAADVLS
jgi:hypothetical protein